MLREALSDPVLLEVGVAHGFGQRESLAPQGTIFPRQVHGVSVVGAEAWAVEQAPEADAIFSCPGRPMSVGIVTADCVPILAASEDGTCVAAIHAGWRGLAAGVIEFALEGVARQAGRTMCVAAVGPAARGCCYEVDAPVRDALSERYGILLEPPVLISSRDGHFRLDLPLLASRVIQQSGVETTRIGTTHRHCTICDADRFESYRRDGSRSGRLRHFVTRREPE